MHNPTLCPRAHDYEAMVRGRLSPWEVTRLTHHLEQCDRCAAMVQHLQTEDPLLQRVRRAQAAAAELPEDSLTESLIEQVCSLGGRAPALAPQRRRRAPVSVLPPGRERGYPFLTPPRGPKEIGWLAQYRVLRVLGQGGKGIVFAGEDSQLRRPVALKVLNPELVHAPGDRERFFREARTAAALRHEHLVTLYEVGQHGNVLFLAMELLQGESLQNRLKREATLPPGEVLRIGRELAEGLAAAHDGGLLHLDIKPGNIWLEEKEERGTGEEEFPRPSSPVPRSAFRKVKILDFGLACGVRDFGQLTSCETVLVTPSYIAPEQARGEAVDVRCDLYSLGCVLYRLCTGVMPVQNQNAAALLSAQVPCRPRPPRELNPDVPAGLSDLVVQLLAGDREERPPSARAVREQIAALERIGPAGQASPTALPPP